MAKPTSDTWFGADLFSHPYNGLSSEVQYNF